jgi:hypothetical protein
MPPPRPQLRTAAAAWSRRTRHAMPCTQSAGARDCRRLPRRLGAVHSPQRASVRRGPAADSRPEHRAIDCADAAPPLLLRDLKASPSTPVRIRQAAQHARVAPDEPRPSDAALAVSPAPELWYVTADGQSHKAGVPDAPGPPARASGGMAGAGRGGEDAGAGRSGRSDSERDERAVAALFDEIVGWSDGRRALPTVAAVAALHPSVERAASRAEWIAGDCTRAAGAGSAREEPRLGLPQSVGARTEPAGTASPPDEFWDERSLRSLFAAVHSPPPPPPPPGRLPSGHTPAARVAVAAAAPAPEELFPSLFGWDELPAAHGAVPGPSSALPAGDRCRGQRSDGVGAVRAGGGTAARQTLGEALLQLATWALPDEVAELLADARVTPVRAAQAAATGPPVALLPCPLPCACNA